MTVQAFPALIWIEKKLDRLQKKVDATKSKFDNLFTVKKKANNIDTQISQTEALLKATEKAAKKYKLSIPDFLMRWF